MSAFKAAKAPAPRDTSVQQSQLSPFPRWPAIARHIHHIRQGDSEPRIFGWVVGYLDVLLGLVGATVSI